MVGRYQRNQPPLAAADADKPIDNSVPHETKAPQFAQPEYTPDPDRFVIRHGSDTQAYKALDAAARAHEIQPLPYPKSRGENAEPTLTLAAVLGADGRAKTQAVEASGRLVFHAIGDTGNTRSTEPQNLVADKLATDFQEAQADDVPQFLFHLGDVIYSFGESQYYYDQFYEPYRNYPAPILALAGNHDGMVAPDTTALTLEAYLTNFCANTFQVTPQAGGLDRTAQIQPGVYFTFEAPFLRIIALYSNTLEDPGVISSQDGEFPTVPDYQIDFLKAALARAKDFRGALIIAHHHPAFTAGSKHGWSQAVTAQIDAICEAAGVWPHAVLSAHAHNYQRFTRYHADAQIPYVISGNGGHGIGHLVKKGGVALRVPQEIQVAGGGADRVVLESYDDQGYGYLRIIVDAHQLRIEYHPASDGGAAKTPDDSVTVELASRQLAHYTGMTRASASALDAQVTTVQGDPPSNQALGRQGGAEPAVQPDVNVPVAKPARGSGQAKRGKKVKPAKK